MRPIEGLNALNAPPLHPSQKVAFELSKALREIICGANFIHPLSNCTTTSSLSSLATVRRTLLLSLLSFIFLLTVTFSDLLTYVINLCSLSHFPHSRLTEIIKTRQTLTHNFLFRPCNRLFRTQSTRRLVLHIYI